MLSQFIYAADPISTRLSVGNPRINLEGSVLSLGVFALCEHILRREEL